MTQISSTDTTSAARTQDGAAAMDGAPPLARLSALGQSVWIDFLSRAVNAQRAPAEADRRVLGRRRDLEPHDLPEGDGRRRRLRRGDRASSAQARTIPAESSGRSPNATSARPATSSGGLERTEGRDGYVSIEVDPRPGVRHARHLPRGDALHETIDKRNLLVKIPATKPGLGAIEDVIAKGHSINVTLIFSLDATRRSPSPTSAASSAWSPRAAIRRRSPRSRASSSRASTPRPTSAWTSSAGHDELKGRLAIANAQPRLPALQGVPSPARAGTAWPPRARSRSACCGPRPRRRTRNTPTRSTSRS